MTIQAICPASCGELLQGYIGEGEKLISYSINLFSKVSLIEKKPKNNEGISHNHRKAYRMLEEVFKYYGYNEEDYKHLCLKIDSPIPIAKGMASSTADLVATATAAARYLDKAISEEEVARLAIGIEPTDSIVFSKVTLFDHLKGHFHKQYGSFPDCKVLLLEGRDIIDTIDFRKTDRTSLLKTNEKEVEKALLHFEIGINQQSLKELGKAATISGFANQRILHKEGLEEIHEMSQKFGAYGINVAHSGSVIGILYKDTEFDREGFCYRIKDKDFMKNYLSIHSYDIIPGGGRVLTL